MERVPQFHDPTGKVLELALAWPFHQHVETRWYCCEPPGPWGNEDGVQPRFQQLVEAPRGACTFPIQTAPCMAKGGPHVLLNQQQIADFPIQIYCREWASSVSSELRELDQTLPFFDRSFHWPSTAIDGQHGLSREDSRGYRGKHENTLTEKPRLLRQCALLLVMGAADFSARCFGLLGCHTVDMQQATEFPLILILAGLGIFHDP